MTVYSFMLHMEERGRRFSVVLLIALAVVGSSLFASLQHHISKQAVQPPAPNAATKAQATGSAADKLETLAIKGRAPKTGYSRDQFSAGWADVGGCDTRNYILKRDMTDVIKAKYSLWVTQAEHDAMKNVLSTCPGQVLPSEN
jgi:hypothetical protein